MPLFTPCGNVAWRERLGRGPHQLMASVYSRTLVLELLRWLWTQNLNE